MVEPIHEAIQVLLDHPRGEGAMVSCYADTSMTGGFQWLWPQHLKNEAHAIEQRLKDDREALARFARDLGVVRQALAEPSVPQAGGMAVFSAVDRGLFRAFPLGVPVKDCLVLDEAPYLVPLLEARHRQRRYLLVLTDSRHGCLYEAAWGHTRLLQRIEVTNPRRQKAAGELWGKQQATIARHHEDHLLHYRKALSSAIEQSWPDAPFRGLILLGDHETVDALRAELPPDLARRVVYTGRHSWARRTPTLDDQVRDVLTAALRAHDALLVEDFDRRMREHHFVAAGPQEVIHALRNGQVGYPGYLLLEHDRGEMAARCTRCGSLFTTIHSTCPVCQGLCEKVNLWQELLLFAARHNIPAHTVDSHPALSQHGGVAAVLSRAEPWKPAPVGSATPAGGGS